MAMLQTNTSPFLTNPFLDELRKAAIKLGLVLYRIDNDGGLISIRSRHETLGTELTTSFRIDDAPNDTDENLLHLIVAKLMESIDAAITRKQRRNTYDLKLWFSHNARKEGLVGTGIDIIVEDDPRLINAPPPEAPIKEVNMGFGKAKTRPDKWPDKITDADLEDIPRPMYRSLMAFLNRGLYWDSNEATRQRALSDEINKQPARAQTGYEIIVLGKDVAKPINNAEGENLEARYLELARDVCKDAITERGASVGVELKKIASEFMSEAEKDVHKMARKALQEASENYRPLLIKDGAKTRKVKGVLPPEFERMVKLASQRKPIMLVGPAGCGKTYLCEKLAEALDMEFSDQSCSEGMSESVFNGLLLPIGANGAFKHVSSPFMDRYENGGIMLLDEIDAGDPNLFTYINKAVANSSYTVAQRWLKPTVKKHGDFVLVAAANTFGHGADAMYVGRNQLDAATLDRFKVGLITMDYSRTVEEALAPKELCQWAWNIRDKIKQHKLRRIMSTRVIKDMADMAEAYKWDKPEWDATYFAGWSNEERRAVA